MAFSIKNICINIKYSFFLAVSLFLVWDKTGWACITLFSMMLHEISHIFVMLFLGIRIKSLTLCPFGINIEKEDSLAVGYIKESLIYLAGPVCNLILAIIFYALEKEIFSAINLAIGLVQLIPIAPLDGGQILKCFVGRIFSPDTARNITAMSAFFLLIPLAVASIMLFLIKGNFTLIVLLIAILMKKNDF